jgi:hypothetical protein
MLASYLHPYHQSLAPEEQAICERLAELITAAMPEAEGKIWHAHPVWFLEDNPVVGYSKQKKGIRLMFWSGADFGEALLNVRGGKFKDASVFYSSIEEIERPRRCKAVCRRPAIFNGTTKTSSNAKANSKK